MTEEFLKMLWWHGSAIVFECELDFVARPTVFEEHMGCGLIHGATVGLLEDGFEGVHDEIGVTAYGSVESGGGGFVFEDEVVEIPNDAVIVCAGGVLPTSFLRAIGVDMETKWGTL